MRIICNTLFTRSRRSTECTQRPCKLCFTVGVDATVSEHRFRLALVSRRRVKTNSLTHLLTTSSSCSEILVGNRVPRSKSSPVIRLAALPLLDRSQDTLGDPVRVQHDRVRGPVVHLRCELHVSLVSVPVQVHVMRVVERSGRPAATVPPVDVVLKQRRQHLTQQELRAVQFELRSVSQALLPVAFAAQDTPVPSVLGQVSPVQLPTSRSGSLCTRSH